MVTSLMVETEDKFDLILTSLEQIIGKLNIILTAKSSEEKGSEVGSASARESLDRQTEEEYDEKLHKIVDSYKFEDSEERTKEIKGMDHVLMMDLEGEKEHVHEWVYNFKKGRDYCECGANKATSEQPSKTQRKYKISGKPCKICDGLISWDDFDTKTKTGRPVHVDGDGYKLGTGACPNWRD